MLYCDDRGAKETFGANFSTARLVRIEATGRANVEQALGDISGAAGALSLIPGGGVPMNAATALAIHTRRRMSGFSLVEAMVSLIVISVGMIGIAALYGQA